MYVVIKGGEPTDWYSSHSGIKYKVIHEGHSYYLVESDSMGSAWRVVKKYDCEKTDEQLLCDTIKQNNLTTDKFTGHDAHYDNTHGSLYKFAEEQGLNAWEFDVIKRLVRCRKKGQFKEDLEKTKRVIDLYLKEYEGME